MLKTLLSQLEFAYFLGTSLLLMIVHPWSSAQSDQACCDFLVIAALCLLTVLSFHHFFFQMDCTSNPALIILSSNNFSLLHPPIHRLLLSSPYLCPPAVANPTVCRPSGLITHYYCLFTEKRVHRTAPHWSGSSLYRAQSPWRSMGQTTVLEEKRKWQEYKMDQLPEKPSYSWI